MDNIEIINWNNDEVKQKYKSINDDIKVKCKNKQEVELYLLEHSFGIVKNGYNNNFDIIVYFTNHFIENLNKSKYYNSHQLWNSLSNIKYGYNPLKANSPGGKDGIFNITKNYKPKNDMIRKLFDKYLDTDKGQKEISKYVDLKDVIGIRIVAHGFRLLGFINYFINDKKVKQYKLILIDIDYNK